MKARSFFEQNGGTYTQVGEVLIPTLTVEETKPIGRWGRLRKNYLKEHHSAVYLSMLLDGTLHRHLAEIDETANERIDLITKQLADKRGITETLKAEDPLRWVQEMNAIRASAEETALAELIYAFGCAIPHGHYIKPAWIPCVRCSPSPSLLPASVTTVKQKSAEQTGRELPLLRHRQL